MEVLVAMEVATAIDDVLCLVVEDGRPLDEADVELEDELMEPETTEDESPDGSNAAAIFGLDDKNPAVMSPTGQPLEHGFDLQHPMNGGLVKAHVYHLLPVGHS